MNILQLKGITKEFGKNVVLDDINLDIHEGDLYGIIGPSGCGKTTLLNTIIGFHEPDEGTIQYKFDNNHASKIIHKNLRSFHHYLGYAPQYPSFYPNLTVKENIKHFGYFYKIKKNNLTTNMNNLLEFTQLKEHQKRLAKNLSGGMQKRLDLCCSLIHKPRLLVRDEPTDGLDPLLQDEMFQLIKEVNSHGITVVISSHNLSGLESICNKVAILHEGKLLKAGDLKEMKKNHQKEEIHLSSEEFTPQFLSEVRRLPVAQIIQKHNRLIISTTNIKETLDKLLILIEKSDVKIDDLDIKKVSLKRVFEHFTKKW